jgi:hypothetical protein
MTKHCIARMDGRRQRFFNGRFTVMSKPVTTGRHDRARAYDDKIVAQLVCAVLNATPAVMTHGKPWAVMQLPEARK